MAALKNRRIGPDTMVRIITVFSILTWCIIILSFFIYQIMHPSMSRYNSVRWSFGEFRTGIVIMKVLLFLNFLLCIWGIAMNMMRYKRKSDKIRKSLIITAVVSLVGFILMMVLL